ncbi:MAG: hypothetical protein EBY22_16005 [Gammaproteobacteria bacterium]|nr:hypothetical protein [Gammaproteobacteria bacterium]
MWFPAKDDGDDILIMDRTTRRICTVQIKVSRDYLATHMDEMYHKDLKCCGWFTPQRSKIESSKSDFWILGLHTYELSSLSLIILTPSELLRRYTAIHGDAERLQSYFWLTKTMKVFEARGLDKTEKMQIVDDSFSHDHRDFSNYLNDWAGIKAQLKADEAHLRETKNTEQADAPNYHAFGTFVTDPAEAGSAPKASGSRSSGTFAKLKGN